MSNLPEKCPVCGKEHVSGEKEKCPECGEIMEKGFIIGGKGAQWWPSKPFPWLAYGDTGERIAASGTMWQWSISHIPACRCKKYKIILIRAPEMEISEAKTPKTPEELYEQLLHVYTTFYGGGRQDLENKIEPLIKQGLSREEAIHKLAEKEKLIPEE